jgi:hypothetical protein
MQLYQPTITGSLSVSGSINLSGSITIAGGGTISGTASIATNAITASSADNFLVRNTLTAQTLVVQTITSSVDFVTGSTQFGSLLTNTHVFSGSVSMNPNGLFVSSSGNVGIGTTNPATYSGYTTLAINNAVGGAVLDFLSNGTRVASINNGGASFDIETKTATPMVFATTNTERMRITSGGLVGIGTSSPSSMLHINTTSSSQTSMFLTTAWGGTSVQMRLNANETTQQFNLALESNHPMAFWTNSTEKMRITSGGNVGIGTSSPTNKLHLVNDGNTVAAFRITDTNANGSFLVLNASDTDSGIIANGASAIPLDFYTGGSVRMRITSGGNVGIGTSSPSSKLQIDGETRIVYSKAVASNPLDVSSFSGIITVNTNNVNGSLSGLAMYANSDYNAAAGIFASRTSGTSADLVFYAGSATAGERMRITSGGIVGVGNTAPSGHFEIGSAGFSNSTVYGGHLFTELRIAQGTWTTFANVTNNSWAGITELNWVGTIDYNRSGAAYMRWAYESGAAALGVVYTLFNNSQNATATFRNSGGALQINISGGTADYYVQVRVQGSRAS